MENLRKRLTSAFLLCFVYAGSSIAAFGIGIHYTIDGSVKMPAENEQLTFDNLHLKPNGFSSLPEAWRSSLFGPQDIPIYFDRGNMMRTPFGLGAKIYVDIFPFIDCIELSGDIVMFQYDGKIKYPVSVSVNQTAPSTPAELLSMIDDGMVSVEYDSISTNIEDLASTALPGISKTPYIKLDLGITIRKYIKIPIVGKFIRPYGGLGFDCIFATPVPSAGLVNDAIGEGLSGEKSISEITTIMSDPETPQKNYRYLTLTTHDTPFWNAHYGRSFIETTGISIRYLC